MESANFNPKVSIIIPVYMGPNYQHPGYLRQAVDSALGQTYKNIEVIVVNDGSNDGGKTEDIAKSYGDKIRYFSKENGGVSSALNLGIREMKGEYFSWLSHDDVYYSEKIEKQVRHLEDKTDKNIVTYCAEEMIDEDSNTISVSRIEEKYLKTIYLAILSTSIGGCSLVIPKVCFDTVGLFNEKLRTTQDNEMWLRIAKAGYRFEHLPEILVKSRVHLGQVSSVLKDEHREETARFYEWALDFIGKEAELVFSEVEMILLSRQLYRAHSQLLSLTNHRAGLFLLSRLLTRAAGWFLCLVKTASIFYSIVKLAGTLVNRVTFRSARYWEKRYAAGGDSGVGSFGKLALYKAEVINAFIRENNIKNVIEFGCGDGNQLQYYNMPDYIGIDVSGTAVEACRKRFKGDTRKEFYTNDQFFNKSGSAIKAELTLSVDVLYHLVEDKVFQAYVSELFRYSSRYVVIYSTNFNMSYDSPHQRDREIVAYIEQTIKSFELMETIINPYKGRETMSDFFIYRRISQNLKCTS